MRNDFLKVQNNYNKEIMEKESILGNLIPLIKKSSSFNKQGLINYFKDHYYSKNTVIMKEGAEGENIYILARGSVLVQKKYRNEKNIYYTDYVQLQISKVEIPTIFGEELVLDPSLQARYQYTITVASSFAKFFVTTKTLIKNRFHYDEIRECFTQSFKTKEKARQQAYEK